MKNKTILLIFILIIMILVIYFGNSTKNANFQIQNEQYSDIKQDLLPIPVDVYTIKYDDENISSTRNDENILEVFENVNSLWSQANIKIDVKKIEVVTVEDSDYYYDLNSILSYMVETENYNPDRVNAYFAKTLHGSNGIAFPGNRIMIADETSVYDFRATSHEIGHVLGLQHVGPVSRLMARGVNGFDLTTEEINIARDNALRLFNNK